MKTLQKRKVNTYVSYRDIERLRTIQQKYGYKSLYQLLQHLIYCFLRVADPDNDVQQDEPIPEEIEDMFGEFTGRATKQESFNRY